MSGSTNRDLDDWLSRSRGVVRLQPERAILKAVERGADRRLSKRALGDLFGRWLEATPGAPGLGTTDRLAQRYLKEGVAPADVGPLFVRFLHAEFGLEPSEILRDFTTDRVVIWLERIEHAAAIEALLAEIASRSKDPPADLMSDGSSPAAIADGLRALSSFDLVRAVCRCATSRERPASAQQLGALLWMLLAECRDHGEEVAAVRGGDADRSVTQLALHHPVVAELINAKADVVSGDEARRVIDLEWDADGDRLVGRAAICPTRPTDEGSGRRQRAAIGMDANEFADLLEKDQGDPLLDAFKRRAECRGRRVPGSRPALDSEWRKEQDLRGVRPYLLLADVDGLEDALERVLSRIQSSVLRIQVLKGCEGEQRDHEEDLKTYLEELHQLIEQARRS